MSQKNVPPLASYNCDTHEGISILFGRYRFTMPPQVTCASALPGKTGKRENQRKNHIFTQLDCVTHTMHLCAVFLKEKVVICNVFDSIQHFLR